MTCLINRLPDEILAMSLCTWAAVDEDAPWIASSVCQHWRRVALASPIVWSRIHVNCKQSPQILDIGDDEWCIEEDRAEPSSPQGKQRPLSLWVERTGTVELHLHVRMTFTSPVLAMTLGQAVTLLAPEMKRIRELDITTDSSILAMEFLNLLRQVRPPERLVNLAVRCDVSRIDSDHASGDPLVVLSDILRHAPLIQTLEFSGCCPSMMPKDGYSCLNLRSLVLTNCGMPLSSLLLIVKGGDNLTNLRLSCIEFGFNWQLVREYTPSMFITLSAMTELSIHKLSYFDFIALAPCLVAPNVRSLSLTNLANLDVYGEIEQQIRDGAKTHDAMAALGEAMVAFMAPMSNLESLHLSSSLVPDRHFLRALQHLPNLVELKLHDLFIGAPAVRGLTPPHSFSSPNGNKAPVCPKLARLMLSSCDFVAGSMLVDFVHARWERPDVSSLRYLEIDHCLKILAEHVESIRQMGCPDMDLEYSGECAEVGVVDVQDEPHEPQPEDLSDLLP